MVNPSITSTSDSVSEAVVAAVAAERSTSPIDMTPPLYEAIDTDALDEIVRSADGDEVQVAFEYQGFEVTVSGTGRVDVDPTADSVTAGTPESEGAPPRGSVGQ